MFIIFLFIHFFQTKNDRMKEQQISMCVTLYSAQFYILCFVFAMLEFDNVCFIFIHLCSNKQNCVLGCDGPVCMGA